MELLKPIIVKRWVSEIKYIEYIFDNNVDNKYDNDVIIIPEYIFQDDNKKDALNKIAYHIYNYEKKNLTFPYYCWDDISKKSLLFDIKNIHWSGYNINPFKSKDKKSKQLDEPIEYINNDNNELFNYDKINIVFYNDFNYDIKYYYNKNENFNIHEVSKLIKNEIKIIDLYKLPITKITEQNEYYNEVIFEYKMEFMESLIILFDKFKTDEEIQLIQFVNNNNAIYKLYKYHTFDKKDLDYKFRLNSNKKESKDISLINLYYKNKNTKLSISKDGIFKLIFKYDIDNGTNKANILLIKDDIVKYLSKFNIHSQFKEIDINLRVNYSIDNLEYQKLIKKIGTYTNIFEDFIINKKKCKGVFKYKRISGNSIIFDLDLFIINRYYIEDNIIDEIFTVLKNMGINITMNYIKGVIDKKAEIDNIKSKKYNDDAKEETIVIIKEYNNNIDFYVDIKKADSFLVLDNLKFWLIKIIEDVRNEQKNNAPKKKIINNLILPKPTKKTSYKSPKKSSSSSKSKKSDDSFVFNDEDLNIFKSSSGGAKNSINDNNYLINKLNNADKELYKDRGKGKNPARKCQKEYQPLVLKKDEIEALKKKGIDPYDKNVFDNYIEYGSSKENKNFYTCPRIWCPISNIPLEEKETLSKSLKCPEENETPIMMNEIMKNKNKSRYVYLLKGDIEIPCCGKRNPEKKGIKILENKKVPKKLKKDDKQLKIKDVSMESKKESEYKDSKDNIINENDKNYIMNKIPVPKNRFGGVQKEVYHILFNNHKDYTKTCLSNNNINKNNCVLRKGINNSDNIINSIAYLLGTNKDGFIEYIENNLDIVKFLSLENGNVFKDFADIEPLIPDLNNELYIEFLNFNKKTNNISLEIPDIDNNTPSALYQKSRLLYIYKSYKKFIKYLKTENSNSDIVHYLYTLVAILYNKLIVLWNVEIGHPHNDVSIVCPRYSTINDLLLYLGKKAKVIMIMITTENKIKDNLSVLYYEPIILKSLNKKEVTYFNLEKHINIKNILDKCTTNIYNSNEHFVENIENMKTIKTFINKKLQPNYEGSKGEIFRTVIINKDLSIDKIILKKDNTVISFIKFKKISIIMLDLIIKNLHIKDVVFSDDINNKTFDVYILKDTYTEICKKFEKIDIEVDIGEITKDTNDNGITIKNKILFKADEYNKNRGIIINIPNKYNDYNKYSREQIMWQDMKKTIYNNLLEKKYDDKYYKDLSIKTRKEIIKILLTNISENKNYNSKELRKLQIILEGINIYSRESIKNWYSNNLSYEKYNYVNDISNNIKEDGDELIFTQYLVSEKIPDKIIRDRDYLPNNNIKNTNIDFYELKNNMNISNSSNKNKIIPSNWQGVEKAMPKKWEKYKKKIWYKLKYIESVYTEKNISDLFEFLLNYDNKKINNIISFDDIIQYTYNEYKDILVDNYKDDKYAIDMIFSDPHFRMVYINTMNIINNTNKTFKTKRIFLDEYLYKSSLNERKNILNRIKSDNAIKYYSGNTLKQIATYLDINIIVILERIDYGKGVNVKKRAGSKDLKVSMKYYNAGNNNNHEELLKRPLIMLYQKIEKSFISYYLIKNIDGDSFVYNELNNANQDIKNIIYHPDSHNKSNSPTTIKV